MHPGRIWAGPGSASPGVPPPHIFTSAGSRTVTLGPGPQVKLFRLWAGSTLSPDPFSGPGFPSDEVRTDVTRGPQRPSLATPKPAIRLIGPHQWVTQRMGCEGAVTWATSLFSPFPWAFIALGGCESLQGGDFPPHPCPLPSSSCDMWGLLASMGRKGMGSGGQHPILPLGTL